MNRISIAIFIFCIFMLEIFFSCSRSRADEDAVGYTLSYTPNHASGFKVYKDSISGKTKIVAYGICQTADPDNLQSTDSFEFLKPVQKIVCTSSTHVAMLTSLGNADKIIGVSGMDYISDKYVRDNKDRIVDIGYDSSFDMEKLAALKPDIVLLYGIDGTSPLEGKLKEISIPYLYIGDYLEQSPLGKAEWIVALGYLTGRESAALMYMDSVSSNYKRISDLASEAIKGKKRPRVILNTPFGESWYMPSDGNYLSRLIYDAGGTVLNGGGKGNDSETIDMETAFSLASDADFWLNVGTPRSIAELKGHLPMFGEVKSVRQGNVYNNTLRTNTAGGNDFYESGAIHPDIVLSDIVEILHPDVLPSRKLQYYYQLR